MFASTRKYSSIPVLRYFYDGNNILKRFLIASIANCNCYKSTVVCVFRALSCNIVTSHCFHGVLSYQSVLISSATEQDNNRLSAAGLFQCHT